MKRTKIVCTIGPASDDKEILTSLVENGLNVARFNFSHGSHEEHKVRFDMVKEVREELGQPIGIMLDTKGPEIRLKQFSTEIVELITGDKFTIVREDIIGDKTRVSISYKDLHKDVKKGNTILIDDGLVELVVDEIKENGDIECTIINSGILKNNKGVNVPNIQISLPAVTGKDIADIIFGIKNDIDFIAASFIRKAEDVIQIRKVLEENGGSDIKVFSKIENREGVENIDEILAISDGIMVARGDLGVEIPAEEIPLIQKEIIRKCNYSGKQVIVATQMLDSMQRNPRPTRAEVADVANAILDGADAIMLSGETAAGMYPKYAVETMKKIALKIEDSPSFKEHIGKKFTRFEKDQTNAISQSACIIAEELNASVIVAPSVSGLTAISLSKYRPVKPIICATHKEKVRRRLSIVWGVESVINGMNTETDLVIEGAINSALGAGHVKDGQTVIVTAGVPAGVAGTTNLIKVHTIGKVLIKGTGIGKSHVTAKVAIGNDSYEIKKMFEPGMILVTKNITTELIPFVKQASGIITEESGLTSSSALVALSIGLPCILDAENAEKLIKNGELITIDTNTGIIYEGQVKTI